MIKFNLLRVKKSFCVTALSLTTATTLFFSQRPVLPKNKFEQKVKIEYEIVPILKKQILPRSTSFNRKKLHRTLSQRKSTHELY